MPESQLAKRIRWGNEAFARRVNIMLYGFPGSGKTTLAAQFPKTLIIEIDPNGYIVLNTPELRDKVRFTYIRDFKTLAAFVRQLQRDPILDEFETVVLDSVSELQTLDRLSQLPGDVLVDDAWKFNEHIYTVNNFRINVMVQEILKLNKNTVLISHMVEDAIGEGRDRKVYIRPAISPSLLKDILAQLDGAFFLEKENETRRLRLVASSSTLTKSRFPIKNGTLINPTYQALAPILNQLKQKPQTPQTSQEPTSNNE